MKRILLIPAAAAAIAAVACTETPAGGDASTDAPSVSISQDTLRFGPEGGNQEITVSSSDAWRMTADSEWASASALAGNNGDKVSITAEANESGEERVATFKIFTGSAVCPLTVISSPEYRLEIASGDTAAVAVTGGDVIIMVDSNTEGLGYTMDEGTAEWLTELSSGDAFGKIKYKFSASENTLYTDRAGKIVFSGSGLSAEVTVLQAKTPAILTDTTYIKYGLEKVDGSLEIRSNLKFEITSDSDWLVLGNVTAGSEEDGLTAYTVPYSMDATTYSRVGKLHIVSTEEPFELDITIKQENPDAVLATIPDSKFREVLADAGLVILNGDAPEVELTQEGISAKEINIRKSGYTGYGITSVEGIEAFTEAEVLNLGNNKLTSIDISKLTKVKSIDVSVNFNLVELKLGDNPVETAVNDNNNQVDNVTVSGSKVKFIDFGLADKFNQYMDALTTLDLSGCPSLEKVDMEYRSKIQTIIVKSGLKDKIVFENLKEGVEIVEQ